MVWGSPMLSRVNWPSLTWTRATDLLGIRLPASYEIVPVTPWLRVLLMNPPGCTWETNLPSVPNEIVSFVSPTVPIQSPTMLAAYCASSMGVPRAHRMTGQTLTLEQAN